MMAEAKILNDSYFRVYFRRVTEHEFKSFIFAFQTGESADS